MPGIGLCSAESRRDRQVVRNENGVCRTHVPYVHHKECPERRQCFLASSIASADGTKTMSAHTGIGKMGPWVVVIFAISQLYNIRAED